MKLADQYPDDLRRERRPTSPAARAMLDALEWLDGRKVNDLPGLNVRALRSRAIAAAVRYETSRPSPDGRPTGTLGGRGGTAELNSVESAAESRLTGRRSHDPIHEHTHRVLANVTDAARHLQQALADLDKIDRLTAGDTTVTVTTCELCTEAGLPNPPPWDHYGDVNGKLPVSKHLCTPHQQYITKHGEPPTGEQTRHHDTHGTWRLRATG